MHNLSNYFDSNVEDKCKPFFDNVTPLEEDKEWYDIYKSVDYKTRRDIGFIGQEIQVNINNLEKKQKLSKPACFSFVMKLGIYLANNPHLIVRRW